MPIAAPNAPIQISRRRACGLAWSAVAASSSPGPATAGSTAPADARIVANGAASTTPSSGFRRHIVAVTETATTRASVTGRLGRSGGTSTTETPPSATSTVTSRTSPTSESPATSRASRAIRS